MPQILLQNMYAQIMKTNFNKILEHNMYGVRAGEGEVKTLMKLGKHAPVLPAIVHDEVTEHVTGHSLHPRARPSWYAVDSSNIRASDRQGADSSRGPLRV